MSGRDAAGQAQARELLSALFLALRTAHLHEPTNEAYRAAVDRLFDATTAMFAVTGGFQLQLVEGGFFINGVRIWVEGAEQKATRALDKLLTAKRLGGLSVTAAPDLGSVESLLSALQQPSPQACAGCIGLLGMQRFDDGNQRVDRRVLAVHVYAKLLLNLRVRLAAATHPGRGPEPGVRLRLVRVVQGLIDLVGDQSRLLLRLANTHSQLPAEELFGVSCCVLTVTLGHHLGVPRRLLCDLGVVALLHHLPPRGGAARGAADAQAAQLADLLEEASAGTGLFTQAMLLGQLGMRTELHPLTELLLVCRRYAQQVSGLRGGARAQPPEAVQELQRDDQLSGAMVRHLIDCLRVYPVDTPVRLKSGRTGFVVQLRARYDRPLVQIYGPDPEQCDLEVEREEEILGVLPVFEGAHATEETSLPMSLEELSLPPSVRVQPPVRVLSGVPAPYLPSRTPALPVEAPPTADLKPAAPPPPPSEQRNPHDELTGALLDGKYRLIKRIGQGGMGTVFLAEQQPMDREVAVKVLLPNLVSDATAGKRFNQEARTISKMRHPNTVTVYDFGQTARGDLYIVMEYLKGHTVASLLRTGDALDPRRAARIIWQTCGALDEAHRLGVVHRDLKPDNLFITQVGDDPEFVKVLDFGLAKLIDEEAAQRLTQAGKVFGTPRYMAPEQAEGRPVDFRSDIYTLGVVLFELVTARPLFTAQTVMALLMKHIRTPPPRPSELRPDLRFDPELERLLQRILSKEPDQRPQTMRELAELLERYARNIAQPLKARAPTRAHGLGELDEEVTDHT